MKGPPARAHALVARLRWLTVFAAVLAAAWIFGRFELLRLPGAGCSPLRRFTPGALLLVDRRPPHYRTGDAVFFETPERRLSIALIAGEDADGVVLVTDEPMCPAPSSAEHGAFARRALRGRILLSWAR